MVQVLLQEHDDDYKDNEIFVEMITGLTFMKCMGTKLLVCVADPAMPHSYPPHTILTCVHGDFYRANRDAI